MITDHRLRPALFLVSGLLMLVACGGGSAPTNSSSAGSNNQPSTMETIFVYTTDGGPRNLLQSAQDRLGNSEVAGELKIQTTSPNELIHHCTGESDLIFPDTPLSGSERKQCEKNQFKPLKFVLGRSSGKDGQVSLYANESSLERREVRSYLTSVLEVTRGDSVTRFGYEPAAESNYARNRGKIRYYQ